MRREAEDKQAVAENEFKSNLFAANPELFFQVYPEDNPEPAEVEEYEPESEEDVQQMLDDFKQYVGE